jgi:radical SAM protein with 4Fe4S-binding SPASM domain
VGTDGIYNWSNPWFVLEVTSRCNTGCLYCYNVWHGHALPADPNLDCLKTLFAKLDSETDIAGVTFAGGEPLLSPVIDPLAEYLSSLNLPVGIVTNGILLDDSRAWELSDAGVRYFEISMPAFSAETGIALTGTDIGRAAMSAVVSARPFASRLTVSSVLTELNAGEIVDIAKAAWSLSADAFYLNRFVPGGRGVRNRDELTPDTGTIASVLTGLDRLKIETGFPIFTGIPIEPCRIPHEQWPNLEFGPCVCGTAKWAIDPQCRLRICEQSPGILGNLLTHSFPELTGSLEVMKFRSSGLRGTECDTCPDADTCGGGCRFLQDDSSHTIER